MKKSDFIFSLKRTTKAKKTNKDFPSLNNMSSTGKTNLSSKGRNLSRSSSLQFNQGKILKAKANKIHKRQVSRGVKTSVRSSSKLSKSKNYISNSQLMSLNNLEDPRIRASVDSSTGKDIFFKRKYVSKNSIETRSPVSSHLTLSTNDTAFGIKSKSSVNRNMRDSRKNSKIVREGEYIIKVGATNNKSSKVGKSVNHLNFMKSEESNSKLTQNKKYQNLNVSQKTNEDLSNLGSIEKKNYDSKFGFTQKVKEFKGITHSTSLGLQEAKLIKSIKQSKTKDNTPKTQISLNEISRLKTPSSMMENTILLKSFEIVPEI